MKSYELIYNEVVLEKIKKSSLILQVMIKNELYSGRLKKGSRTYFFDIKQSEKGDLYLKISEQKHIAGKAERHRIIVFEENFDEFEISFGKLFEELKKLRRSKDELMEQAYVVDEIRKEYRQAYMPWTKEDDDKLELLFCKGKTVKELALIFERKEGAIRSRIKKLELKEKYDL